MKIYFKPLEVSDFEQLYKWLRQPNIQRWWENHPKTFSEVVKKYSGRISDEKYKLYLFGIKGEMIGYIQSYIVEDPRIYKVQEKGVGIDLFIGESDFLHKGYGTEAISVYIEEVVKKEYDLNYVFIDPDENNLVAIKSYMKVGFKIVNTALCQNCGNHNNAYMILKIK